MATLKDLVLESMSVDIALPVDADGHERRAFASRVAAGKEDSIEGYAALFNVYSDDLGGFVEIIEPGFFDGALDDENIRALWQHKPEFVLGRTKNETLSLIQDDTGLAFRALPPLKAPNAATWAMDAMSSIRRGDVDQCSFSFSTRHPGGDEWYFLGDKLIRRLRKGGCERLWDVAPVTYPAYRETNVSARSVRVARIGLPPDEHSNLEEVAWHEVKRRRLELAEKS